MHVSPVVSALTPLRVAQSRKCGPGITAVICQPRSGKDGECFFGLPDSSSVARFGMCRPTSSLWYVTGMYHRHPWSRRNSKVANNVPCVPWPRMAMSPSPYPTKMVSVGHESGL